MLKKTLFVLLLVSFFSGASAQERLLKFVSKDSVSNSPKIVAWMGANMKMNGYYNIKGGLQEYDTFNIGLIDVYGTDNRQNLGIDLYQTQVRFDAAYIHPEIGKIQGHISWDFWGGNGQMRLRKAYIKTDHWQVGQDWENFGDQNIWPNVLDFDGPPSGIWARLPFVKYFNTFSEEKWAYEIALQATAINYAEFPNVLVPIERTYQTIPDGVLAIKRQGSWGHIRLSTIYRAINYIEHGNIEDVKKTFGYGASISGMIGNFGGNNFQFQTAAGKGISAYIVSFGGSNYDAYPHSNSNFETTPSFGGWASYEYYVTKKLHFNLVYGYTKFEMNDIAPIELNDGSSIREVHASSFHSYILTNFLWDPYPNFSIGVEFNYGLKNVKTKGTFYEGDEPLKPTDFDEDQSRDASRISFGFMYNF
ncbi:MAG: hypothetical protein KAH10_05055 [Flavobacteriales bacterium]|nr:hypothetical protein [Flavobacteriales bacterium]